MNTIKKRFMVSTAHRLVDGYVGKCNSLHGHNFFIDVELAADDLNGFGFVVDFNDLKEIGKWIDEQFDHGTWLNARDPLVEVLRQFPEIKVTTVEGNPTVEIMSHLIYKKLFELYDSERIYATAVTVEETPNNNCRCDSL